MVEHVGGECGYFGTLYVIISWLKIVERYVKARNNAFYIHPVLS